MTLLELIVYGFVLFILCYGLFQQLRVNDCEAAPDPEAERRRRSKDSFYRAMEEMYVAQEMKRLEGERMKRRA